MSEQSQNDDNLEESIRDNASGPAEASGDSTSVKQHRLKDQIEADRYLASKKSAKSKGLGIGRTRVIPPGAV